MFIATCRSHPESHRPHAATSRCADAPGRARLLPRVRAALKMPWSNMRPFVPNIKKPTARNIRKPLRKSDVSDELADDVHLLNQVGCSAELVYNQEHIAYVHIDAPLEVRLEHYVGTH